jgi:hypothetical protein
MVPADNLRTSRVQYLGPIAKVALDAGLGRSYKLSDLQSYTEYTALFNEYRINKVTVIYLLATSLVSTAYPRIAFCVDVNDGATPTLETDVLQYKKPKLIQMSQTLTRFEHTFVPRVAMATYSGAFSSYATAPAGQWLDTDSPSVQHYGTKEYISNYNSTNYPNTDLRLYIKLDMEFRRPR